MSRDDDSFDYSFYRTHLPRPIRREMPRSQPRREQAVTTPLPRIQRKCGDVIPPGQIKSAVKNLLAHEPDLTVEQIRARLNFGAVTVSTTTLSGFRTEFRHSLRVMRDAGLLK
jgi:hypothetical protein